LVDLVIALGLEEEMFNLPGHHRGKPASHGSRDRVREHQSIGAQEADRAEQVQGLVDPAVMIIAMIIPSLRSENLKKPLHHPPTSLFMAYTSNVTVPAQFTKSVRKSPLGLSNGSKLALFSQGQPLTSARGRIRL
jgi:hypothetical protein